MAIDCSLVRTGVAILDDGEFIASEVIETKATVPNYDRLRIIQAKSLDLIYRYLPDIIAIETSVDFQRMTNNSRASIEALAQARAACLIAAGDYASRFHTYPVEIKEIGPHDVREAICGNRNAGKAQVQANLAQRGFVLPLMPSGQPDPDVADAIGVALSVYLKERILTLAREQGYVV